MQFPVDVLLSPDGNHLYVSAVQGNILAFNRDSGTGQLTTLQGAASDGNNGNEGLNGAYGLSISDDGNFIYALLAFYENSVAVYRRDPARVA